MTYHSVLHHSKSGLFSSVLWNTTKIARKCYKVFCMWQTGAVAQRTNLHLWYFSFSLNTNQGSLCLQGVSLLAALPLPEFQALNS